jgi:hypothetical protein
MRFGRVEGVVVPAVAGSLRLTVYLDTGTQVEIVRDEIVPPVGPLQSQADWIWHADQYTQETIGIELARLGWEVVGAGQLPTPEPGALARSAAYAVRTLG